MSTVTVTKFKPIKKLLKHIDCIILEIITRLKSGKKIAVLVKGASVKVGDKTIDISGYSYDELVGQDFKAGFISRLRL